MGRFQDLSQSKFGRLQPIKREENRGTKTMWLCKCDCGNEVVVAASDLKSGRTKSCGCLKRERETHQLEDLTGRRFGKLTVESIGEPAVFADGSRKARWVCRCDCGNVITMRADYLKQGHYSSCGCCRVKYPPTCGAKNKSANEGVCKNTGESGRKSRHGLSHTRLYKVWKHINSRCNNPNEANYKYYGGRGISVCEEWRSDFVCFYEWAIANGYDETAPYGECTIDRIDVDGNYEPQNCRWVDMKVQASNKRRNKKLTA